MRERLSYTEEKENAWNYITDLIFYMNNVPVGRMEKAIYKTDIKRLAERYGLKKKLRATGYNL